MTTLNQAHCEACRADAPQVSEAELPELLKQIRTGTSRSATR